MRISAPLRRLRFASFAWLALPLLLIGSAVSAQQEEQKEEFLEGVHYQHMSVPQQILYPTKIEVMEFFRYSCPHCYRLHPVVKIWQEKQEDDVIFRLTPHVFTRGQKTLMFARAYYAAMSLKRPDIHDVIFERYHSTKIGVRPSSLRRMTALFVEHGVDEKTFTRLVESFGIRSALVRSEAMSKHYSISGVPTIIVQGKYKVVPNRHVPLSSMFRVVDYLIDKERKELNPEAGENKESAQGGA